MKAATELDRGGREGLAAHSAIFRGLLSGLLILYGRRSCCPWRRRGDSSVGAGPETLPFNAPAGLASDDLIRGDSTGLLDDLWWNFERQNCPRCKKMRPCPSVGTHQQTTAALMLAMAARFSWQTAR